MDRSLARRLVAFAVGLAFADASIVVLALPQIVGELDTTISRVTWVIISYNVALIVGVLAYLPVARRISSSQALVAGLALFGLASIGCGIADDLKTLVALRAVQGIGGAVLLCASLPMLAAAARPGESPTARWAAAAALGAAIGPAAGGVLTQVFDWRAIFLAQAPAAALAIAALVAARLPALEPEGGDAGGPRAVRPGLANLALLLLSAGLIGALFLVVILLIDVWRLEPLGAAAVVSALPLGTVLVERVARGRSPIALGSAGAILLAVGLFGISLLDHRQLGWVILALALCGAGIGLAFTTLSDSALTGEGPATSRAGITVAARDAGLIVGLLVLTPIFVNDLDKAPGRAVPQVAIAIYGSPLPKERKDDLADELLKAYAGTPQGRLPDLDTAFANVARADPSQAGELETIQEEVESIIERAATSSFQRPLRYSALFALLVVPVLAIRFFYTRRRLTPQLQ